MSILPSSISTASPGFRQNDQHFRKLIATLHERRQAARLGGDEKAKERHVANGKLLPRDRIDALLDPGSPFLEIAELAGDGLHDGLPPGAGIITGIGRVRGRICMIIANDATVMQITKNVLDSLVYVSPQVGIGDGLLSPLMLWNVPNPFDASTDITFEMTSPNQVRLAVFDVMGRRVKTLVDEPLGTGTHSVPWNGLDDLGHTVAPGIYMYRLQVGPLLKVGKALKSRE